MKLSVLVFCAMAGLACSANSYAGISDAPFPHGIEQQRTRIRGVVADENGNPLVGASVIEMGTESNGVITDVEGRFTLTLHSASASITVSYIGCRPQTLKAVTSKEMKIVLYEDVALLDEVMVVAFGKQTRESFTGSAGVVKSDAILERQVSNPVAALNGKVAGLQMIDGNGPTTEPTILIRGIGSLTSETSPLIVLDGLPYNGYLNDINTADVESVTVLKDAASSALYGSRAANGVVLITTKSAKRGKAQISLDARWGVNTDGRVLYDYIDDPGQYYETHYRALFNKYYYGDGQSFYNAHREANSRLGLSTNYAGLGYMVYSVPQGQMLIGENGRLNPNATLGNVITYKGKEYTLKPDDWRKEGLRNGLRQEYNVNINGGTEQFQFYGSLGYLDNEGLTYGSDYTRYTAHLKADYQARSWLRIGGSVNYVHSDANAMTESFLSVYTIPCIYPLYLRDGQGNIMTDQRGKMYDYGTSSVLGFSRPLQTNTNNLQDDRLNRDTNSSNSFNFQGYMDFSFLKDFKLTLTAGVLDTENRMGSAINPYYGSQITYGGYVSTYHYRTYSLNLLQQLNWNKVIGKHNIALMLAHDYERDPSSNVGGAKNKVYDFNSSTELSGAIAKTDIGGYTSLYNKEGYMFRALYDYDSTYYANLAFRRDGSSVFHPSHRWGNFWSAGLAWIISKEKWFNVKWADMLKLKVSYGEVGNDRLPSSYPYVDIYQFAVANDEPAYIFYSKGAENISWEKNRSFNAGLEFELLGSRLTGSVEYYRRKTSDMLLWFTAPLSLGYDGYYDNVGDMLNHGVEVDLNAEIIRSRLVKWSVNLNLTHNRNKVTYLPDGKKQLTVDGVNGYSEGTSFIGEGIPVHTWYMQRYAGVAEDGQSMWYYTADDGSLATTTSYDLADYYLCGDPNPDLTGGFGTSLTVGGFDLSMNFLYSVGGKAFDTAYQGMMRSPYGTATGAQFHKDILKAWSPENTESNIPRLQYDDIYTNAYSDRFLTDASTLTFKNISLGYTFPKSLVRKMQLTHLRLYVSCDNVAYWSKRKGFDPRGSFVGSTSNTSYSPMRTISGGINIQF